MANKFDLLESYVNEYEQMINVDNVEIDDAMIEKLLMLKHGWTPNGAARLMRLVDCYGAFILAHAYALAVALGKEDGDLGL